MCGVSYVFSPKYPPLLLVLKSLIFLFFEKQNLLTYLNKVLLIMLISKTIYLFLQIFPVQCCNKILECKKNVKNKNDGTGVLEN